MTVTEFVVRHGVGVECRRTGVDDMVRYEVTLHHGGRAMTVPFSVGSGWTRDPDAADVLNCLADDSCGTDVDFEDWCHEYGFDADSRRAERLYNTCCDQAEQLRMLLGGVLYNQLLYDTERL